MFYNILDQKRIEILPLLKNFKKDFYLAGGTALALQLGHRDSIDFVFFNKQNGDIDTKKIFDEINDIFKNHKILKVSEDKNTLNIIIDDSIKLSFFGYKYDLLNKLIDEENIMLGSVEDIGCMKLSAITSRASNKDYIDLYYILHKIELKDLLKKAVIKFPTIDTNIILKSLVYFDDVYVEPIIFKNNNDIDFEEVKTFLKKEVKELE
ncbi:nucleotidyl transferase AbiEii/AbiGii toxin family protein [Patescibacteria group bacterium]|nr:nucleotidyl transferase AbiEii/AbiGii toxin family protein [Patescibacteria group bacterium]MCG2695129.1 nucleotidyl transferase AbiEii/AbiGii toxin family protein [Candidatus Parcubacteria bacterium]